jgi:peptide/nickel transport system permease protein
MLGFIVRRLISAILVVVLTSMLVFALFYKGPTNPARDLCLQNGHCTAAKEKTLEHDMGLDVPLVKAYTQYVGGMFHSRKMFYGTEIDCPWPCLGISYANREPITKQILQKYPATAVLALGGAILEVVLGIAIGVFVARYKGSLFDRGMVGGTLVLQAIPYYILAILAWVLFTLKWPLFPQSASGFSITGNPGSTFHMFALPWLLIGITGAANYIRYTRGQMIETLSEDYVRTAVAKGASARVVLFQHALRAAIVPVVTIFGLDLAVLLTGTIFTEHIFGIDGVGNWSILSMGNPIDFPVLTANTILTAVIIVVANLVVDVVYGFLDPRVRIS